MEPWRAWETAMLASRCGGRRQGGGGGLAPRKRDGAGSRRMGVAHQARDR
jgi:hypothetical protein